jgi:transcriptional regulator with XRE-family HTH domain
VSGHRGANFVDHGIGLLIRTRRLELGVSQETLAEMLGITFQQVQKYEKGVNRVAASRLFELAAVLDVPIGYFFQGLTTQAASAVAEAEEPFLHDILATPEGAQLMALFGKIESAKLRRRIIDLVKVLVDNNTDSDANSDDA